MRAMEMKKFNVLFDHLIDSLAFIAGSFIFIMMGIECYEVVSRYFFQRPTTWSVEFCEYMLFLLAFLGTTWVLKKRAHINVTILLERLRPRTQIYCNLFSSFMGILISLIIFWFSLKTSVENYVVGVKVVKTYALPKWIFLSFISLGYLLLLIEFVRQFFGHLKSLRLKERRVKTP
jgi:TRAP-type C4-dicarboxylate transport system permease small subunit